MPCLPGKATNISVCPREQSESNQVGGTSKDTEASLSEALEAKSSAECVHSTRWGTFI